MQSKTNDLEAIEKLVQRYRQARNMKKAAMDLNMAIPSGLLGKIAGGTTARIVTDCYT